MSVGAALRGFGRALMKKGKKSPTIKSIKPAVGSLKKRREDTEQIMNIRKKYGTKPSKDALKAVKKISAANDRLDAIKKRMSKSQLKEVAKRNKESQRMTRNGKATGGIMMKKVMKKAKAGLSQRQIERIKKIMERRKQRMGQDRGRPGKPGPMGKEKRTPSPSPRKPDQRPKTYPPRRIMTPLRDKKMGGGMMMRRPMMKKGGRSGFPDLSGDGKVTKKDILMGRGVIAKKKK